MLKSIRMRLTVWYVGILTLVLGIFGGIVYTMMARAMYERLDARLHNVVDVVASSLRHEIEEHGGRAQGEEMFRGVLATIHQAAFPEQAIAIYDGSRQVARKPGSDRQDPILRSRALQLPGADREEYESREGWRIDGRRVNVKAGIPDYLFVAAEPETTTLQELRRLRATILLAVPLSLLLAAAGGYWLARKSLSPVVAMSRTVDQITASNLDRRIRTANSEDELGRLGATFNRLLDRLQRSFEQQRQFMADASHELRTPVSIARTAAEVTLELPHRDESEYRDAMGVMHDQLKRLTVLVQDMFLLARADAGALTLRRESLYLDELVAAAVKDANVLAKKKHVSLRAEGLVETPFSGDEALLRRLLLVLLDNAVKFTPAGSEVVVRLGANGAACRIQVRDSGPGIPEADASRIFERFYRAEKSRARLGTDDGGAGLGLAIGRSIAEAHGGSLRLVSTGPQGTAFEIQLPLVPMDPSQLAGSPKQYTLES